MTTMARPSMLLLYVVIGLFVTVHSQRLTPVKDSFEITFGVVIPCGSRCVVQSYRAILDAVNKCILFNTGIAMEVQQYIEDNNLNDGPTYQQIYDAMFSEGRSPICGWFRTYGGCLEREFGRICGRGVMDALKGLFKNFDTGICSQNPNYLACVAHPSLLGAIDTPNQQDSSPYARCATSLISSFANIDSENYYTGLILRENGGFLFGTLRTFGNCIGDAIKTVTVSPPTGCAVAGEDIKKYINDALDYFNFGQNGKDYVKCFANPALHTGLTECGQGFETDLRAIFGDSFLTQLNTTLLQGRYTTLKQPYSRLSACFKSALNQNCGSVSDSAVLVNRMLHPLDHLFDVRSDNPAFCSASGPATPMPATPVPPVTRLRPLADAFEITTEVVIPCGSRCVVQSYRDVLRAGNRCLMSNTGIVMVVEKYLRDNNLIDNSGSQPTYQQIYDAMFSEGNSPLCGWYDRYGGCFEREFGRICGRGVMDALTGLVNNFETLVCSQNPNYVACVTHPSLLGIDTSNSQDSPYARCAISLGNNFLNTDYDNYYDEVILRENGGFLFRNLRIFGNCIGDAVKTVTVSPPTGCAAVGDEIKKYVNDALNYFNFGQNGKDYVKCFSNPALHMDLTSCGKDFASDLQGIYGDTYLAQLNNTLFIGGYSALQRPYRSLSTCFKRALSASCRRETDSVSLVNRCLHPLDHLFGLRTDPASYCNGAATSVASLGLVLSGIFMLLGIILRLH